MLTGGRNSGQKAQKGSRKKKVGRKNSRSKFGRMSPKVAEKGPKKIDSNDKHTEAKTIFYFHFEFWLQLNSALMFCESGRTFLMYWPENNLGTWQHCRNHPSDINR
jgi:hypothetical protein